MPRQKSSGNYLPLFFLGFFASFLPLSLLLPMFPSLSQPFKLKALRSPFPALPGTSPEIRKFCGKDVRRSAPRKDVPAQYAESHL